MNAEKLVKEIEGFSKNKLKRKDDLKILIEVSIKNEKMTLLKDLSFTAKYVLGLQRALKKGSTNPEIGNIDKIKEDYSDNLIKSLDQVKEITDLASEKTKNDFNKIYFELSRQSLQNLNELLEDLEWTKMYFNHLKHINPIS